MNWTSVRPVYMCDSPAFSRLYGSILQHTSFMHETRIASIRVSNIGLLLQLRAAQLQPCGGVVLPPHQGGAAHPCAWQRPSGTSIWPLSVKPNF